MQGIYNRYVGPNVLYLSHMLLYIVFEWIFNQDVNGNIHHPLRGIRVLHRVAAQCRALNADKSSQQVKLKTADSSLMQMFR